MRQASPLDMVTVSITCSVSWESMTGDEQVRYCSHCRQHVYNLSAMTRAEAEKLLTDSTGRRCVRFYQRPDGKVLTRDCSATRVLQWGATLAIGMVVGLFALMFAWGSDRGGGLGSVEPFRSIMDWFGIRPVIMGEACPAPGPLAPGEDTGDEKVEPPKADTESR